ncbi:galanin receptor 2a-like [Schistocerca piceifrons]|uniref:galanin receptor 2a-like n=2 Tax=Schistocerca TaxID=7008 RepID=UPI001F5EB573|nr:galanin receptor 2a-like [Schistocerca piceifrons]XP_049783140.1 galanin receptor 2a-like [Schistocerca cancellata]XP_049954720.1 galanin receptor 2a-like [Schistocerca serialis cubense]
MGAWNASCPGKPAATVCMADPAEMLKPWKLNSLFFHIVGWHAAALVCGVAGNALVLAASRRSATSLFLASLAAADLLLLLLHAPLDLLQYFVASWDAAGAVCRAAEYAASLSAAASVLNLAAVTIERFLVIVFPMKSRSYCTLHNCRRAVLAIWLLAPLLTVPVLLTKGTYAMLYTNMIVNVTIHHCADTVGGLSLAVYQLVLLFGAPGVLMLFCYSCVIVELWKSTRSMQVLTNSISTNRISSRQENTLTASQSSRHTVTRRRNRADTARATRKQVIKMLILVVVLFLLCWGPRIIMNMLTKIGLQSFTPTEYTMRVVFNILPVIHACFNPVIYSFMSKNFRRSLKRQFETLGCRRNLSRHRSSSFRSSRLHHGTITQQTSIRPRYTLSSSSSTYNADVTRHTEMENTDSVNSTVV